MVQSGLFTQTGQSLWNDRLTPSSVGCAPDRRDAEKLAELYRVAMLTPVWVPDLEHEALRDLVRARTAAKKDETRAKHRLTKYLLRYGLRHPNNSRAWTHPWWRWVQSLNCSLEAQGIVLADCIAEVLRLTERVARLDHSIDRMVEKAPPEKKAVIEALQALRGVAKLTAVRATRLRPISMPASLPSRCASCRWGAPAPRERAVAHRKCGRGLSTDPTSATFHALAGKVPLPAMSGAITTPTPLDFGGYLIGMEQALARPIRWDAERFQSNRFEQRGSPG